jgi:hypothetical protein
VVEKYASMSNTTQLCDENQPEPFADKIRLSSICFDISPNRYGEMVPVDLIPGGGDVDVTNENRGKFVELYVKGTC